MSLCTQYMMVFLVSYFFVTLYPVTMFLIVTHKNWQSGPRNITNKAHSLKIMLFFHGLLNSKIISTDI